MCAYVCVCVCVCVCICAHMHLCQPLPCTIIAHTNFHHLLILNHSVVLFAKSCVWYVLSISAPPMHVHPLPLPHIHPQLTLTPNPHMHIHTHPHPPTCTHTSIPPHPQSTSHSHPIPPTHLPQPSQRHPHCWGCPSGAAAGSAEVSFGGRIWRPKSI